MKKKETIYAFIDSQNLNLRVKSSGWNLDWKKFILFLKNKYGISKAYLFIGYIEDNFKLYDHLCSLGYNLIFKKVLCVKNGKEKLYKGNVDAELVLSATTMRYHKAIIISGDGDFYCLIAYLEKKKKLLAIMFPNRKYSSLLKEFQEYIDPIYAKKEELEYKK